MPMPPSDKQETTIRLTQEEVEQIKNLPKRTFIIGNIKQTGLYDEATKRFYYLDANGDWNGRLAIITMPPPPPAAAQEEDDDVPDENEADPDFDNDADDEDGEQDAPSIGNFLKKLKGGAHKQKPSGESEEEKKNALLDKLMTPIGRKVPFSWLHIVVFAIVLALAMIFIIVPSVNKAFRPVETSTPPVPNTPPVTTATPDPSLDSIQVIQVTKTLIPGDTITEDNIQAASISAADYEMLRASGRLLYQWDVVNNLLGKVLNTYIPKGSYIASGDESSTYTPPSNPWVNQQQGMTYVTMPLDATTAASALLNFGAKVDIDLKKETTSETVTQEDGTITTTVSTKPYSFDSVIVCDILNSNQESIYPKYSAYLSIPAGAQLDYIRADLAGDAALIKNLTPAYIQVKIDSAVAEEIGDFTAKNVSIVYTLHAADDIDVTTDAKRDFAAQARELVQTIDQAITLNAEAVESPQPEQGEDTE